MLETPPNKLPFIAENITKAIDSKGNMQEKASKKSKEVFFYEEHNQLML